MAEIIFIYSFKKLTEHLLCTKHCTRCLGDNGEPESSLSLIQLQSSGEQKHYEIITWWNVSLQIKEQARLCGSITLSPRLVWRVWESFLWADTGEVRAEEARAAFAKAQREQTCDGSVLRKGRSGVRWGTEMNKRHVSLKRVGQAKNLHLLPKYKQKSSKCLQHGRTGRNHVGLHKRSPTLQCGKEGMR